MLAAATRYALTKERMVGNSESGRPAGWPLLRRVAVYIARWAPRLMLRLLATY